MGFLNQWKIISLETNAQDAYRKGNYQACYDMACEGLRRLDNETHSSMPINWEMTEKLVELRNKAEHKLKYGPNAKW